MIYAMLWIIGAVVAAVLFAWLGAALHGRHEEHRERGGRCLACGSVDLVEVEDDQLRCQACGYTGGRDGGGPLTPEERQSTLGPPV